MVGQAAKAKESGKDDRQEPGAEVMKEKLLPSHQQEESPASLMDKDSSGISSVPVHNHGFIASTNNATTANAQTNILAQTPSYTPYIVSNPNTPLNQVSISPDGGSQPHTNFQPYLCVDFIISLFGIFPSPT
jgi:microcystin-dependent protein